MHASRRAVLAAAVFTSIAAMSPLALAADAPITIMVGGINKIIYLPAKLTEALGYFKDEGLNVELQSQPAGVDAENQLIAGAVQACGGLSMTTPSTCSPRARKSRPSPCSARCLARWSWCPPRRRIDLQDHGRCQGQDAGRDGPGFVHRLFDTLPGRPPGGCRQKDYSLLARGRGQHLHRSDETRPHSGGHDYRAHCVANAQDRRRQSAGGPAFRGRTPSSRTRVACIPPASLYVQNSWADTHKAAGHQAGARLCAHHGNTSTPTRAEEIADEGATRLLRQRQGAVRARPCGRRSADVHHRCASMPDRGP